MILAFGDRATADVFAERSSRAARNLPVVLWPAIRRKLKWLDVAQRVSDLASPPGNHLEALKGEQRGRHSIRVNDQWRVCFEWPKGSKGPLNVEIVDYH